MAGEDLYTARYFGYSKEQTVAMIRWVREKKKSLIGLWGER